MGLWGREGRLLKSGYSDSKKEKGLCKEMLAVGSGGTQRGKGLLLSLMN